LITPDDDALRAADSLFILSAPVHFGLGARGGVGAHAGEVNHGRRYKQAGIGASLVEASVGIRESAYTTMSVRMGIRFIRVDWCS
jgi:hypothetical protein